MRWDPKQTTGSCLVNLFPYPKSLAKLYADVVKQWEWKQFLIIYEDDQSLMKINQLLLAKNNNGAVVKLRKLQEEDGNYRPLLREIKEMDTANMVLDCSINLLPEILIQAQQVGLMGSKNSWIITNLDFQTLDLEPYKYGGANITGFSLFDPNQERPRIIAEKLSAYISENITPTNVSANQLSTEVALMYDAVKLFTIAVKEISFGLDDFEIKPTPCNSADSWTRGFSIINFMKTSTVEEGVTGSFKFDHEGFRSDFQVHIVELTEQGLRQKGRWSKEFGIHLVGESVESDQRLIQDLRNVTFNLIISLTKPYGMRKKSSAQLKGNAQFEGYCVDLIEALSVMSGFKYNILVQADGKSGSPVEILPNGTKRWDGMVGALLEHRADLACTDLTITREREEDVDFATPFMDLGIAILYKKPTVEPPGYFSFLSPFKTEVWMYLITSYISVSLLFYIMGRISPYEWTNPYPCVQDSEILENQFTLSNSFWFTIGALMQQGSEIAPVSVSTRCAAGIWWFFTLIMVASYTANLAAFLTIESPSETITGIEDLAHQNKIKYGAKKGGSTFAFFKEQPPDRIYHVMYNYMLSNQEEVMTDSSDEGVKRALEEDYAFLMESTSIEYVTERECTLTLIGKPLDNKGYGIAMRKGSWYLGIFSQNILYLQEKGKLSQLKRKWWKEKYAGTCVEDAANEAVTLGLSNVGGVFIVLAGGIGIAMLLAVFEMFIYVWSVSSEHHISFKERLLWELKFFVRCHGTVKPVPEYQLKTSHASSES